MLAGDALDQIKLLYSLTYRHPNVHPDAAVFIRHESAGRLHCEVIAYFSPNTANFANDMGATPCRIPTKSDLSLFAGSESSWHTLFEN